MPNEYLLTGPQMLDIYSRWGVDEKLPNKGKIVIVCFPTCADATIRVARVSVSEHKSTYGKRLYKLEFGNE